MISHIQIHLNLVMAKFESLNQQLKQCNVKYFPIQISHTCVSQTKQNKKYKKYK